jgi:hypothetical protein
VLCYPLSGIPELVEDRVSGFLVPEADPAALADRVAFLADRPDEWAAMGRAGRARIEAEYNIRTLNDRSMELKTTSSDRTRSGGGTVIISYDDGDPRDLTSAFPVHETHGVPAEVCVPSSYVDQEGRLTKSELLDLQAAGREVVSHTKHPIGLGEEPLSRPAEPGDDRLCLSRHTRFNPGIEVRIARGGAWELARVAARGSARAVGAPHSRTGSNDLHALSSTSFEGAKDFEARVLRIVDRAADRGGLSMFHAHTRNRAFSEALLERLIERCLQRGLRISTRSDYFAAQRSCTGAQ